MQVSFSWLKEFVDPGADAESVAHRLTMAGLEVGALEPAAEPFSGVVVGHVAECGRHPDADKLSVCEVSIGEEGTQTIVCGAPNVRAGMNVAVATVGARLPGGLKIRKAKLRGVTSHGMICSARELGLGDEHDGILPLPADATPGDDARAYLDLDDQVMELDLTANRGDCHGMRGVAREVGVLFDAPVTFPEPPAASVVGGDAVDVELDAPEACPRYLGRIVRGIDPDARTPLWMCERLRRAGLRPVSPVVDVTNYVLLETGQPMHGFDLRQLAPPVRVRFASPGETLTLLDTKPVKLGDDVLVIADETGPLALAGIMGGEKSGVADDTVDVFFECAWFAPGAVAGRARRFGLHTDASHRYERGVDPAIQHMAMERATQLLQEIAGGEAGPLTVAEHPEAIPQQAEVSLSRDELATRLGVRVPGEQVSGILRRLGFTVSDTDEGWRAMPPSHRFDISGPEDLIEEVARVFGYENIDETPETATLTLPSATETRVSTARVQDTLVDLGFQEVITYSFIDPGLHEVVCPGVKALPLANPISSDLAVMRASLWPGLLDTLKHNLDRQQERVRVFETGLVFDWDNGKLEQPSHVAFAMVGSRWPEHWDFDRAGLDLHDGAAVIEALLSLRGAGTHVQFVAAEHAALHPGQSANVLADGEVVGRIGSLHPERAARLDLPAGVFLAELDMRAAFVARVPQYQPVSRFPFTRRDVSVVVDEDVSVAALGQAARDAAGKLLRELRVFDVYRGKGVDSGRKSVSFGLILQDSSRTLIDGEADAAIDAVMAKFKRDFDGTIRD